MKTNIDPITATEVELDVYLAATVMGWALSDSSDFWLEDDPDLTPQRDAADWQPSSDRNHLADVLAKVPENLREEVMRAFDDMYFRTGQDWYWFLLTARPEQLARAVVAVMIAAKARGDA